MSGLSARPITRDQVRAIHVELGRRGIDDDAYRALLRGEYGAASCKELTRREASELLTRLGRRLPRPPGVQAPRAEPPAPAPEPLPPGVERLATPAQRRLIDDLARELRWDEAHLAAWLRANQGLARVRTSGEAWRVIEGLKAMRRRR